MSLTAAAMPITLGASECQDTSLKPYADYKTHERDGTSVHFVFVQPSPAFVLDIGLVANPRKMEVCKG